MKEETLWWLGLVSLEHRLQCAPCTLLPQEHTYEQEAEPPHSIFCDFKKILLASRALRTRLLLYIAYTA